MTITSELKAIQDNPAAFIDRSVQILREWDVEVNESVDEDVLVAFICSMNGYVYNIQNRYSEKQAEIFHNHIKSVVRASYHVGKSRGEMSAESMSAEPESILQCVRRRLGL